MKRACAICLNEGDTLLALEFQYICKDCKQLSEEEQWVLRVLNQRFDSRFRMALVSVLLRDRDKILALLLRGEVK